jgi:CRISPR-associated protein Cas2
MSRRLIYGGVRAMWILAMFDLPVDSKISRRRYTQFRSALVDDGFMMIQYSVYCRPCPSEENANVHIARIRKAVPEQGHVRILMLTDLQYSRMQIFIGKKRADPEKPPDQLSFF